MGKTTVKAISLMYGDVGGIATSKLMGVLRGLSVGQDSPESTEIDTEFYDSPFDIFYDGEMVTMTFELANYELSELQPLFGGLIDGEGDYETETNAYTTEHSWQLNFGRGHAALYIYRGLTIGTIKKDADGALNYLVTITALIHNTTVNNETVERMYKIVGTSEYTTVVPLPNSLVGIVDGSTIYLGVKMSDGSKRVVSYDGTYPSGVLEADGDSDFFFASVAAPGIHEEQPAVVPFRFTDYVHNAPAGYETLTAELVFTHYGYDPEEALASWTADMYISGVKQIGVIASGDTDIAVSGEPIAVAGDVQIFGDSNCLTYPSGSPSTVYARINTPIGQDDSWRITEDGSEIIELFSIVGANPPRLPDYEIRWLIDFYKSSAAPFTSGQIVEMENSYPFDVDGKPTTFTRP